MAVAPFWLKMKHLANKSTTESTTENPKKLIARGDFYYQNDTDTLNEN